jgi:hypothetical protein
MPTDDELLEKLKKAVATRDKDDAHEEADYEFLLILEEMGYKKSVEYFRDMEKWYG